MATETISLTELRPRLSEPDVLAAEIIEDLEATLEQFREIEAELA